MCYGCGKLQFVELREPRLPKGWLQTKPEDFDVTGGIVACSADCVADAKEAAKVYMRERLRRSEEAIDAAKLVRH
jgi:hypothetical protein